jgi:small subunit ribosomal protein S16
MDGIHQFTKYQYNMAVKIRLARRGRKKMAIYDVVVADSRAPRDGRFIEKIGTYNPNTDPASININNDRALKWLLNGAQPTDTVIGVLKGAVTQEDADKRFEDWKAGKEAAISGKVDKLSQQKADTRQKALEAEAAKNTARAESLKKKEEEALAAAQAAEAPAEEASAEADAPAETEAPESNEENQA